MIRQAGQRAQQVEQAAAQDIEQFAAEQAGAETAEITPLLAESGALSTRAGDLARFTFKGLQADKVQQCYVHMLSYQVVTLKRADRETPSCPCSKAPSPETF